ncbi:RING-type domain-containing protein [Plasmodiophora brassicae]
MAYHIALYPDWDRKAAFFSAAMVLIVIGPVCIFPLTILVSAAELSENITDSILQPALPTPEAEMQALLDKVRALYSSAPYVFSQTVRFLTMSSREFPERKTVNEGMYKTAANVMMNRPLSRDPLTIGRLKGLVEIALVAISMKEQEEKMIRVRQDVQRQSYRLPPDDDLLYCTGDNSTNSCVCCNEPFSQECLVFKYRCNTHAAHTSCACDRADEQPDLDPNSCSICCRDTTGPDA